MVLAVLGFIVTIGLGIGPQVDAGIAMLFVCGNWSILGLGFVWLSTTSIRHGGPRPSMDRLAASIGLLIPLCVLTVVDLGPVITDSGWTKGDVIGLLLLLGAVAASAWWTVETNRRWKLTYDCR